MADIARKNIENMTLKAKTAGYVNVQQNTNLNMMYWGMQLPPFQLGDTTRAGMAVAQIPDLKSWEVSANVGELDRGHLTVGQKVTVSVVALAGKEFAGHVKNIGGTTGPPWDRHFEARIALDHAAPELRPGMTSNMVITVETLDNVLWIPSQALFESDGRTFVYARGPNGFVPHDVTLVRRSESQAVVTGINEGEIVAMSNPDQQLKTGAAPIQRRHEGNRSMILFSDLGQAVANLRAQKTRTMLTALGIVFGVGSVIGMLAIGSGAREESLRFIEQLGVRNVLVDSRPTTSHEEFQQRRRSSPGLSERDVRILKANIEGLGDALRPPHPAPRPRSSQTLPRYPRALRSLSLLRHHPQPPPGRREVLRRRRRRCQRHRLRARRRRQGQPSRLWPRLRQVRQGERRLAGSRRCPLGAAHGRLHQQRRHHAGHQQYRLHPPQHLPVPLLRPGSSSMKDDLDGIELRLRADADSIEVAKVVTAVLNSTHHNMQDFTVTIPAALLAQQQRTQTIFTYVMVAIAAISLLVGGIGIMNIVLATVMERTREIGIRRSIGARRFDIVRQFLTETVLISVGGGLLGIAFGFFLAWLIARTAEWKTIVTAASVVIAFGVSVAVGVIFGIYPAVKAIRINPIDALRYE